MRQAVAIGLTESNFFIMEVDPDTILPIETTIVPEDNKLWKMRIAYSLQQMLNQVTKEIAQLEQSSAGNSDSGRLVA